MKVNKKTSLLSKIKKSSNLDETKKKEMNQIIGDLQSLHCLHRLNQLANNIKIEVQQAIKLIRFLKLHGIRRDDTAGGKFIGLSSK